jgi:hypothetical protein
MLDETLTKRGAAILFRTEFVRPNFVQLSSNFRPTFIPFRPTFVPFRPKSVCTALKAYRAWDSGFTFASETAEKRRHSLPEIGMQANASWGDRDRGCATVLIPLCTVF